MAPWGTIARPRGTWEHKKGDLEVQAWFSVNFGWISGPLFKSVWLALQGNLYLFGTLVSKSFFYILSRSESGRLGLLKQTFVVGSVAKTKFSHILGFC